MFLAMTSDFSEPSENKIHLHSFHRRTPKALKQNIFCIFKQTSLLQPLALRLLQT